MEATNLIPHRLLQTLQSVKNFSHPQLDVSWQPSCKSCCIPSSLKPALPSFYGQQVRVEERLWSLISFVSPDLWHNTS